MVDRVAGLYQRLRAIPAGADELPARQRIVLLVAFGRVDASASDPFPIALSGESGTREGGGVHRPRGSCRHAARPCAFLARLRASTSTGSGEQARRTKAQQGKGPEQHRQ